MFGRDNWEIIDCTMTSGWVVAAMPDRMRLCVELRCLGHEIPSIARRMGIAENTVRVQLRRAKRRIAAAIL